MSDCTQELRAFGSGLGGIQIVSSAFCNCSHEQQLPEYPMCRLVSRSAGRSGREVSLVQAAEVMAQNVGLAERWLSWWVDGLGLHSEFVTFGWMDRPSKAECKRPLFIKLS